MTNTLTGNPSADRAARATSTPTTIQVLEDLTKAIEDYPHVYLDLKIVDVDPAVGTAVNVGEDITFSVQITNSGPLDVHDLQIEITGLTGTNVADNAGGSFTGGFTTKKGVFADVPAHSADDPVLVIQTGKKFHFAAHTASTSAESLVNASVAGWNTDFNHQLTAHSKADTAAVATYRAVVSPQ